MSKIDEEIVKRLELERLLLQLAEECCELGKAALKLERVIDGTNPTPIGVEEAADKVKEEAADVYCVLGLILSAEDHLEIYKIIEQKKERWLGRLKEKDLKYGGFLEVTAEKLRGMEEADE